MRHRDLTGFAHNLAQFFLERWSGFLAEQLNRAAQRQSIDRVQCEFKSREIIPASMNRQLTQRLIDLGLVRLIGMLDPHAQRETVLDALNEIRVEFVFHDEGCDVTVDLVDSAGRSHERRVQGNLESTTRGARDDEPPERCP